MVKDGSQKLNLSHILCGVGTGHAWASLEFFPTYVALNESSNHLIGPKTIIPNHSCCVLLPLVTKKLLVFLFFLRRRSPSVFAVR